MKLHRVSPGIYRTPDGKFRVVRWRNLPPESTTWAVAEWDGNRWDFVCEVSSLSDARKHLAGKVVNYLS